MTNGVQTLLPRVIKCGPEVDGWKSQFVAAHAESDNSGRLKLRCPARYFHGRVMPELARGVKNPCSSETAEGNTLRDLADGLKVCLHVLRAAEHYASRNSDLGIDHVSPYQLFRKVSCDESVVFRIPKKRSDPLECIQEAAEIGVIVASSNLFWGQGYAMSRCQLYSNLRADRSFEMQMQFSLREVIDRSWPSSCLGHDCQFIEMEVVDGRH